MIDTRGIFLKKNLNWLSIALLLIVVIYFGYSHYNKHRQYETYISSQVYQSLGSVVETMKDDDKTSDQALTSILESKSITMEQLNHINTVLYFYIRKIQDAGDITRHLDEEHNEALHSYIQSSLQKIHPYERQLEKNDSKIKLNSPELNFFKQMKDMSSEWKAVILKYNDIPEKELYDINEKHWISLYNNLSIATKEKLD